MKRILFVCHGNICRSPMAEFVLRDMAQRRGLADRICVDSAATSTEELGNPVHPGTRQKLHEAGIRCKGKTSRLLTKADADRYDLIIGMDANNMRSMRRLFGNSAEGKLAKLLYFCGEDGDVADPWYTDNFDDTYRDVHRGCKALLQRLCDENGWNM